MLADEVPGSLATTSKLRMMYIVNWLAAEKKPFHTFMRTLAWRESARWRWRWWVFRMAGTYSKETVNWFLPRNEGRKEGRKVERTFGTELMN